MLDASRHQFTYKHKTITTGKLRLLSHHAKQTTPNYNLSQSASFQLLIKDANEGLEKSLVNILARTEHVQQIFFMKHTKFKRNEHITEKHINEMTKISIQGYTEIISMPCQ